jgi:hypothetical protein
MITNQLLYQLSYTGGRIAAVGNRKRKYYKNIAFCASGGGGNALFNVVK